MKAKSILIVEDDQAVRAGLVELLESAGWHVTDAADGTDALNLFRAKPTDIVLTDLMMPGFNGVDLIRKIRSIDARVPVVVLTAYGTSKREEEARVAGASAFLHKPLDPEKVLDALDRALKTAARP